MWVNYAGYCHFHRKRTAHILLHKRSQKKHLLSENPDHHPHKYVGFQFLKLTGWQLTLALIWNISTLQKIIFSRKPYLTTSFPVNKNQPNMSYLYQTGATLIEDGTVWIINVHREISIPLFSELLTLCLQMKSILTGYE